MNLRQYKDASGTTLEVNPMLEQMLGVWFQFTVWVFEKPEVRRVFGWAASYRRADPVGPSAGAWTSWFGEQAVAYPPRGTDHVDQRGKQPPNPD